MYTIYIILSNTTFLYIFVPPDWYRRSNKVPEGHGGRKEEGEGGTTEKCKFLNQTIFPYPDFIHTVISMTDIISEDLSGNNYYGGIRCYTGIVMPQQYVDYHGLSNHY